MSEAPEETNVPNELCEEYNYPTLFGDGEVFTLETEDGTPVRVLYVGGGFQSATYLGEWRFEPVFAYCRGIDCAFDLREVRTMLMIGGGAFSYPKHLLTSDDPRLQRASIDVVEIDSAIVDIARRHFFLDEVENQHGPDGTGRLKIIIGDGAQVLQDANPATYDVVVNDSFDGTNPTGGLLSPETLASTKRALTADGLYLVNVVFDMLEDADRLTQALHGSFSHAYVLHCPDDDFAGSENDLVIASDAQLNFPNLVAL